MKDKTSSFIIIIIQLHTVYYFNLADSQVSEMAFVYSSWVSQLFTHCISIVWTETIITHSSPLSIAVHLHQTLISVVAPNESYHTIVWVTPETRGHFNSISKKI